VLLSGLVHYVLCDWDTPIELMSHYDLKYYPILSFFIHPIGPSDEKVSHIFIFSRSRSIVPNHVNNSSYYDEILHRPLVTGNRRRRVFP